MHKRHEKLVFTIGTHDFNRGGVVLMSEKYSIHPDFIKGEFDNDIALIFIDSEIPYNEYINRVYLPEINPELCKEFYFSFTGWGLVKRVSCF